MYEELAHPQDAKSAIHLLIACKNGWKKAILYWTERTYNENEIPYEMKQAKKQVTPNGSAIDKPEITEEKVRDTLLNANFQLQKKTDTKWYLWHITRHIYLSHVAAFIR